jgi:phage tail sheath gpL-like
MPVTFGFKELAALPQERITDKISRRVLAGKQSMIVWWSIKAGAHAARTTITMSRSCGCSRAAWNSASARSAAAWSAATSR